MRDESRAIVNTIQAFKVHRYGFGHMPTESLTRVDISPPTKEGKPSRRMLPESGCSRCISKSEGSSSQAKLFWSVVRRTDTTGTSSVLRGPSYGSLSWCLRWILAKFALFCSSIFSTERASALKKSSACVAGRLHATESFIRVGGLNIVGFCPYETTYRGSAEIENWKNARDQPYCTVLLSPQTTKYMDPL